MMSLSVMYRNHRRTCYALFVLAAAVCSTTFAQPVHSQLWGENGQAWDRAGRLPDFSYAGYRRGRDLPEPRGVQVSVEDFGARGDDDKDDTEAFQKAVKQAAGKVIGVPPGRYIITDKITIRNSNTILRGDGPDQSVLFFPTPLEKIDPRPGATTSGRPTSNYSWSGGFVRIIGDFDNRPLARIVEPAERGSTELIVDNTDKLKPGDLLRLVLRDDEDLTLVKHLYDHDTGPIDNLDRDTLRYTVKVAAVDADAGRVTIDRPLLCDVRTEWSPHLSRAASDVQESAIEGLAFEFPVTDYKGHFTELGYNAIDLDDVSNCWVRDVEIRHADSAIYLSGHHNTLAGIVCLSDRQRDSDRHATGHHGVTFTGSDHLLENFDFRTHYIHDFTVTSFTCGNVFSRGKATNLSMDHHRKAPFANLFTDIDAGLGAQLFRCGGGGGLGKHSASWTTVWNIRTQQPVCWPKPGFGPDRMNIIGLYCDEKPVRDPEGKWFEPLAPDQTLEPANLYEAQRARRLNISH